MPELPELEVVREVLSRRLVGRRIERVSVAGRGGPIVVRDLTGLGFAETLAGKSVASIDRRGKYLIFDLDPVALVLVANPKLTGRFQLCPPGEKKAGPVHVVFHFVQPPEELRYIDQKRMGQLYLTQSPNDVPMFTEMGPDALEIDREEFTARLRTFRGEIKGVLTRGSFVAGIGNAYADEILWQARLHPYRKRTSLSPQETQALYDALRTTLLESIEQVRIAMKEDIHLKPREFFSVHMRGGQACPRCGSTISLVGANQRITNFCRECQPGGLIRGM
ncbi:MAG TPA: DNA-formamidopyrimidine glycosylase family protein [Anaerolineales bacterium]|nr:DNA-formamidopyrimidine glycosylase family protein [Anaerolineales bacterium]